MQATITTKLPISAASAWALLERSDTLVYITRGVVTFTQAKIFPTQWYEGLELQTGLKLFGLHSVSEYSIRFVRVDATNREIETQEGGGDLEYWNHTMRLIPDTNPEYCWYQDVVNVQAGKRTWLVWLFAHAFYRYRHLRWRLLLQQHARS